MPQNTPMNTVLPLISTPRLGSYIATFKPVGDNELYGTYVWSQLAGGSVYPLLQNLEITLRNAIDAEARERARLLLEEASRRNSQILTLSQQFAQSL